MNMIIKKKQLVSVALVLTLSLSVTAFAAAGDTTLTYDLSSGGSHDITVKTGDEITVVYKLSADKACSSIAIQNEIYYDHTFFAYVDGSAVKKLSMNPSLSPKHSFHSAPSAGTSAA